MTQNNMFFIGITGGVGAGKSEVLSILREQERTYVLRADDLAKSLIAPDGACFNALKEAFFDEGVFDADGRLDTEKMSSRIFADEKKRALANSIIHPAVKREILLLADRARMSGRYDFFFLEAALLIEEGYDKICDELWYVWAGEDVREERLKKSRGYSSEKIRAVMNSQLSEDEFKRHCSQIIKNEGTRLELSDQIESLIRDKRYHLQQQRRGA